MSLNKQAKTLNSKQCELVLTYLTNTRYPLRNRLIFLLSTKAGLRAKEISALSWNMVLDSDGSVSNFINITNTASKGRNGGRTIPLNKLLKETLINFLEYQKSNRVFDVDGWTS